MGRIALIGDNSVEYVVQLINIWNNNNCAVLLDWRMPAAAAIEKMREAAVDTCIVDSDYYASIPEECKREIRFIPYGKEASTPRELPLTCFSAFKARYSENEAVIFYTSGTTGKSRGVILSHYAINTNADAIIDYLDLRSTDCFYVVKTLSHSSTLTGELLVALKTRTKIIIGPTLTPPRHALKYMERYRATILCINPTLLPLYANTFKQCASNNLAIRTVYVSGSVLDNSTYNIAKEAFGNIPIRNIYGLSEAGPRVTVARENSPSGISAGTPIKGVKIAIMNADGTPAKTGERGVIHVDTPSKFLGYVVGDIKHPSLYQGWLNTGDIGFIDQDGQLNVVGRADDMIIIGSHKIYPSDVEEMIRTVSLIKECVVLKIQSEQGEVLACLYAGEKGAEAILRKKLLNCMLAYEIPRVFKHCVALPRTCNGKISRAEAQKIWNTL